MHRMWKFTIEWEHLRPVFESSASNFNYYDGVPLYHVRWPINISDWTVQAVTYTRHSVDSSRHLLFCTSFPHIAYRCHYNNAGTIVRMRFLSRNHDNEHVENTQNKIYDNQPGLLFPVIHTKYQTDWSFLRFSLYLYKINNKNLFVNHVKTTERINMGLPS